MGHIEELPAELVLHIFRQCSSISAAINLSLTCRRLYTLLRDSQKLPVLFAIAERVWGPVDDVFQLLTYNSTQPVHIKRIPVLSFPLLVQVSRVGRVGVWWSELFPRVKWESERSQLRRPLTAKEAYALRRAIYRIWLYDKAFHNSSCVRTSRLNPAMVAERCQLLRNWRTEELIEIEDVRNMFENVLATDLCPTNGDVFWRHDGDPWSKQTLTSKISPTHIRDLFHDSRDDDFQLFHKHLPATQLREQQMMGWGDEIEQYHALSSLLKLTPADIMWLYEHAVTKADVEMYIEERIGGLWFWNNGETMFHTWILVMHGRGVSVQDVREAVEIGSLGIVADKL